MATVSVVELRFSAHALERMAERSIDEAEVAEVLASPDSERPSEGGENRTVVIGTTPAGRVLMVVVVGAEPTVVVTVAERRGMPRR
jgi:uncharacterized DUF497 family protein